MDQTIHNGLGDHRILKQFKPSLGFDLGGDDEESPLVALHEEVYERSHHSAGVTRTPGDGAVGTKPPEPVFRFFWGPPGIGRSHNGA